MKFVSILFFALCAAVAAKEEKAGTRGARGSAVHHRDGPAAADNHHQKGAKRPASRRPGSVSKQHGPSEVDSSPEGYFFKKEPAEPSGYFFKKGPAKPSSHDAAAVAAGKAKKSQASSPAGVFCFEFYGCMTDDALDDDFTNYLKTTEFVDGQEYCYEFPDDDYFDDQYFDDVYFDDAPFTTCFTYYDDDASFWTPTYDDDYWNWVDEYFDDLYFDDLYFDDAITDDLAPAGEHGGAKQVQAAGVHKKSQHAPAGKNDKHKKPQDAVRVKSLPYHSANNGQKPQHKPHDAPARSNVRVGTNGGGN